jgi:hypothetical protein
MATYFQKCTPLIRQDFQKCSGLTNCDIAATTQAQLEQIFTDTTTGKYRIMGALLQTDILGKACQIEENALYNVVMQYAKHWGLGALNTRPKMNSGLVDIMPFILVERKGIINNNYWNLANGVSGAGTSPRGFAYTLRIDATSMTSIPLSPDWFPDGQPIHISSVGTTGAATLTQWKVVDTVMTGTAVRLYLSSQNSGSRLPSWKTEVPTLGIGMRGVSNISPWERYCAQIPRLNTTTDYPAFVQDTRWTICNDKLTQDFMQHLVDDNPLYEKYFHVAEADYNKQLITDFQNRVVHTFLFQTALPNQTMDAWSSLETITTYSDAGIGDYTYLPGVEGRCVARRANAEGVYPQLYECGRVKDLLGARMNWPELQAELYNIWRIRKANGYPSDVIEIIMDSAYRVKFIQALVRYQQDKYEGAARYNINPEVKRTDAGFVFQEFVLDYPAGVVLRVVSHMSFDDLLTAHVTASATLSSVGRKMWIFEWNSIYMAILESRSVDRRSGNAEEIAKVNEAFMCVIDVPERSQKLNTMKFTTVVDCPKASLWIENFADLVPEHEVAVGDYTDLYGDYASNNATFN